MAKLICAAPPRNDSERAFLDALETRLDDSFTVFGNVAFMLGATLEEGEIDAIILHRKLGMLLLECKGNGVLCDENGQWYRTRSGRRERLKLSPAEQVARNARVVQSLVHDRLKTIVVRDHGARTFPLAWSRGLVFPFTRIGEELTLPLDTPREIVADSADLRRIEEFVLNLMTTSWSRRGGPAPVFPTEESWRAAISEAVCPPVELVPSLSGRVDAARTNLVRLDERQRYVVECVEDNEQFGVCGGAGTGKSLLALETARRWAENKGRRVLLVCFNTALAARLTASVADMNLKAGSIVVSHFHGLIDDAIARLGVERPTYAKGTPHEAVRHFWEVEMPEYLEKAISAGLMPMYDALIVDEAQDFHGQWWYYLRQLVRGLDAGPLVIFYDPEQIVYERPNELPPLFTLRLLQNYRNGQTIAELASVCTSLPLTAHPDAHEGEPIAIHAPSSPRHLVRSLSECVARYLREGLEISDMIILSAHNRGNSSLAGVQEIGGHPIADTHEPTPGAIRFSTIPSFKGLEAEVVFLIDANTEDDRFGRNARYVAVSRATHALHIFQSGRGWSPFSNQ